MNRKIEKILFITLSNIGDCIMTLPALDLLRSEYPQAKITVMSGPRVKEIFEGNPHIYKFITFDKHSKLRNKIRQFNELKKEKFDLVVDLRNTLFGVFLPTLFQRFKFLFIPGEIKHLNLKTKTKPEAKSLYINQKDEEYAENLFKKSGILPGQKLAAIAPGARSHLKRWGKEKFAILTSLLKKEFGFKVILVGDKEDAEIAKFVKENSTQPIIDFTAKTTIPQLACLLKRSSLLITNDSGIMHLASYLNIPVTAIFGPTSEEKYGPWSENVSLAQKNIICRPCEKALCRFGTIECLKLIKVDDLLRAVRRILISKHDSGVTSHKSQVTSSEFKRILIARTDRIGDLVLSTPVIKALREKYPNSYIAMICSPNTRDIVEGNPYLDEVITYDKERKHKSGAQTFKFAKNLKKKGFDLAIILHPANRVHLITYLAGIPRRLGYDRKMGFLLTDKIPHTKQLGLKHELEYNFDLLQYLGIEVKDKELFMPIKDESEIFVEEMFARSGIKKTDKILAIHPCASCPSRIWLAERFAHVADILARKYGFKIVVVAGPGDIDKAQGVIKNMRCSAVDLSGKISLSQLASVLKRCALLISNVSGPAHIAAALGVPVVSIFSASQAGLSPRRWEPIGKKTKVLHKQVGCIECLAHNCKKEFACLKAITVEEVVSAAELLLA